MLTRRLTAFMLAALLAACMNTPSDARQHHKRYHHHLTRVHIAEATDCLSDDNGHTNCNGSNKRIQSHYYASDEGQVIGGRPSGCPHAYCGCGARLYLGIDDPRLNLAWNWTKYYHGSMPVAVWYHHVAIIERMTGPHMAILRDYNSGNGLSRIHERSIAGARIIGMTNLAMK